MRRWLAGLLAASFTNPRRAASDVLALGFSGTEVLLAAVLVAVGLTLLNWLIGQVMPIPADPVQDFIRSRPVIAALLQLAGIGFGALISLAVARLFGGQGSLRDTVMISLWMASVMAVVQVALIILSPLLYPLLSVLLFAALIWSLFAYATGMVLVHGFRSVWSVMAVMLILSVLFVLALAALAIQAGWVQVGGG